MAAPVLDLVHDPFAAAFELANLEILGTGRERPHAKDRRKYAGDPQAYFRDIFGYRLVKQQDEALALIEAEDRVLLPSANNVGKTFLLAGYGVYRLDAVAALPDEDRGLEEQGAQILLPGPDAATIFATLYSAMLEHALRAESRGFPMPGERSEKSVLWRVRPRWFVEAFSPPERIGQDVAHTASGRHHRNQVALIEEGQGVPERVWRATEGMCSSAGNKIISSFNPTEPVGPAFKRARDGAYKVFHLSALAHPNIVTRSAAIPDAVSHRVIDGRVRTESVDRGAADEMTPDPAHHDFVYALPAGEESIGLREDGVLGDASGVPRVYRPGPTFTAQVLGQWPSSSDHGLFSAAAIDRAMVRGRARTEPRTPPDAVGLDPAREGSDDSMAAPRWGEDAEALLRAYADAVVEGPKAVERVVSTRGQRIGSMVLIPKGDGPDTAVRTHRRFPSSPWHVDEGGIGASVYDHAARVLRIEAIPVSFAATPPEPTNGEPWSENMRTAMYVRMARLLALDLADLPDDPALREELLAHFTLDKSRVVVERGKKKRVPSLLLVDKDTVKKIIGRSPDRSDAAVLASNGFTPKVRERRRAPISTGYVTG